MKAINAHLATLTDREQIIRYATSGAGLYTMGGDGPGLGGGKAPFLRQAAGCQAQWRAVQASGIPIAFTSGFRAGSITRSGNLSYHERGRALDVSGSHSNMLAVNRWIASNYGPISKELIYSGPGGVNLHNGRPHRYTGGTWSDHLDHVHWALKYGGHATARPGERQR